MKRVLTAIFLILIFSGCSSHRETIVINSHAGKYQVKTIALLPFSNSNEEKFKKSYPSATSVAYESLETHLLALDMEMADRSNVEKIMKEIKFSDTGLTVSEGTRIGKMINVDAVIIGNVTSYVQGDVDHPVSRQVENTRFGFSVKAIHVESGVILAKVNMFRDIGGIFSYTSPVQALVDQMMHDMVEKLKKKGLN